MLRHAIRLFILSVVLGMLLACAGNQEADIVTLRPAPQLPVYPALESAALLKPRIVFGKSTFEDIHRILGKPTEVRRIRSGPVWIYHGEVDPGLVGLRPYTIVDPDLPLVIYFFEDGTVARLSRRLPS